MGRRLLVLSDAIVSPCLTCETTACCQNLPLHTFTVETLLDLDYGRYLLNFDRVVVGITPAGAWRVFLGVPCRHLDVATGLCTVHDQPEQPHVCTMYNPYDCWYKRSFGADPNTELLRLDRRRWQHVAERTTFDDDRRIVETPSFDALAAEFRKLPLAAEPDAVETGASPPTVATAFEDGPFPPSPCTSCEAPCCTTLVFSRPIPHDAATLDFVKFALGFPGVRVVIGGDEWALAVTTRCRHLDGGRCSVFGQPERPLRCGYFDEWTCTFKGRFSSNIVPDAPLLDLDGFNAVLPGFEVDGEGRIVSRPSAMQFLLHSQRP